MKEPKKRQATSGIAMSLLQQSVDDYLVITSKDGDIEFETNNRTWSLGAATRFLIMCEERERNEQVEG